jgi:hypothetical protein
MTKKIENIAIIVSTIFLIYISFTDLFINSSVSKTDKVLSALAFFILGILLLKRYWNDRRTINKKG